MRMVNSWVKYIASLLISSLLLLATSTLYGYPIGYIQSGGYVILKGSYSVYPIELGTDSSNNLLPDETGDVSLSLQILENTPSAIIVNFTYLFSNTNGSNVKNISIVAPIDRGSGHVRIGDTKVYVPLFVDGEYFAKDFNNVVFVERGDLVLRGDILLDDIVDRYKLGDTYVRTVSIYVNASLVYNSSTVDIIQTHYLLDADMGLPLGIYGLDPLLISQDLFVVVDLTYETTNLRLSHWTPSTPLDYLALINEMLTPLGPISQVVMGLVIFSPLILASLILLIKRRKKEG